MNKRGFIQKLQETLNIDENKAIIINNILETNNIIGKKNKEKIINDITNQLNIEKEQAEKIYETTMSIITTAIKNKIKHPFKTQD